MRLLLAAHVFLVLFTKVFGEISTAPLTEDTLLKVTSGGKLRASRQETSAVAALPNENESVVAEHSTMEEYLVDAEDWFWEEDETDKTEEEGRSLSDRVVQSFKRTLGNGRKCCWKNGCKYCKVCSCGYCGGCSYEKIRCKYSGDDPWYNDGYY